MPWYMRHKQNFLKTSTTFVALHLDILMRRVRPSTVTHSTNETALVTATIPVDTIMAVAMFMGTDYRHLCHVSFPRGPVVLRLQRPVVRINTMSKPQSRRRVNEARQGCTAQIAQTRSPARTCGIRKNKHLKHITKWDVHAPQHREAPSPQQVFWVAVTVYYNDWIPFFLAAAREGTNAEVPIDSPVRLSYECVCIMAQFLAALPARAMHAAMGEAAMAAEPLCILQVTMSEVVQMLQDIINQANDIDPAMNQRACKTTRKGYAPALLGDMQGLTGERCSGGKARLRALCRLHPPIPLGFPLP